MKIHHCFKQRYINVPFKISVYWGSNRIYLHFILVSQTWSPLRTSNQCLAHFISKDFFFSLLYYYYTSLELLIMCPCNTECRNTAAFTGDFPYRKPVWISTQNALFQVQVASNYKAIKQKLHLEVKATWARDTAAFFLWTYGTTASDRWRMIWEQNRHLLLMQMSLPLWVAGDLQESWLFCRFSYFVINSFKKGKGKALFNAHFYLENPKHIVSK